MGSAFKPTLPAIGETVAGKYRILRQIGEGGMAVVFEAHHVRLGHRVALKVVQPSVVGDPELLARFNREARATARLRSVNVVQVLDVDTLASGLPFMVLELLVGHDLEEELDKHGPDSPMGIETAVDYVTQAAAGMTEAHAAGVVHRDLKPGNLFLCDVGAGNPRKLVKVLDFGISRPLNEKKATRLTSKGDTLGTPGYMSPEQVRSSREVDGRTDIWSLGVILFELLTGRLPYDGSHTYVIAAIASEPVPLPRNFRPSIPEALEAAIMRALDKDPKTRFQTMASFVEAIAAFGPAERITTVLAGLPPMRARQESDPEVAASEPPEPLLDLPMPGAAAKSSSTIPGPPGSAPELPSWTTPRAGPKPLVRSFTIAALAAVPLLILAGFVLLHGNAPDPASATVRAVSSEQRDEPTPSATAASPAPSGMVVAASATPAALAPPPTTAAVVTTAAVATPAPPPNVPRPNAGKPRPSPAARPNRAPARDPLAP